MVHECRGEKRRAERRSGETEDRSRGWLRDDADRVMVVVIDLEDRGVNEKTQVLEEDGTHRQQPDDERMAGQGRQLGRKAA